MRLVDKLRPSMIVYGPYFRKDGRKHVVLYDGKKRITVSYPKWIMEQHIERILSFDETIDHIDRDFKNDAIENLQILERSVHAGLDRKRRKYIMEVRCVFCKNEFVCNFEDRDRNKAGPFCSRRCSGLYGAEVQKGAKKLPKSVIHKEYYYINKIPA